MAKQPEISTDDLKVDTSPYTGVKSPQESKTIYWLCDEESTLGHYSSLENAQDAAMRSLIEHALFTHEDADEALAEWHHYKGLEKQESWEASGYYINVVRLDVDLW